ncbi:uncharacterized protein LOC117171124 [Belonocnema kinseyi]|uniref:uncharacterized protein LOC117171124 n=1 Tax=Belonocnema kinseyi TaxID=2817044 RepID=UPI00143DF79C|nr:uncharacterized protein LOC117171124 [Belonocnema kinseyi]
MVEEYKGITLMSVGHKIYVKVLTRSLERQVEKKGNIPHNQMGLRRRMGTIDNVYVLNYIVNRNQGRKKGKLVAFFVDRIKHLSIKNYACKVAFDSVNRRVLWKAMKEKGVDEGLIERIKEIFCGY